MRETKDLMLRLPPDLWKKASYHKIEANESITALITRLLEEYFEKLEKTSENKSK